MVDVAPRDPDVAPAPAPESLTVDCDGCAVRGPACDDCVVTVLLGPPRPRLQLDADELTALDALAGAGLVPPLRLVPANDAPAEKPPDQHGCAPPGR